MFFLAIAVIVIVGLLACGYQKTLPYGDGSEPIKTPPLDRPTGHVGVDRPLDVDDMRAGLQKVSYEMVSPERSDEEKARFKQNMTEFASVDPLVKEIAMRTRELVADSPGVLQSGIYGHFPDYSQEQVRYALYFAHELGWIVRTKKGRSYQLFPPGNAIDG